MIPCMILISGNIEKMFVGAAVLSVLQFTVAMLVTELTEGLRQDLERQAGSCGSSSNATFETL